MLAAYAVRIAPDDPLSGLEIGEVEDPEVPPGWVLVDVKACALNYHDLWSLSGVSLEESRLPMILGSDAAGLDPEGNEVIVHPIITDDDWLEDEILDPRRTLISESYQGAMAEKVAVPARNLVPKPASLSFEEAACLPTAWLTAYRMLFDKGNLRPGQTVLVQGTGGGVATAAIALAATAGCRVWATGRDPVKRETALRHGASATFAPGERLPERVDIVVETVGRETWAHSVRALKSGGRIVVSGATTGNDPPADLSHVFFRELQVLGSTGGTREQLAQLVQLCESTGLRPIIDRALPLAEARKGFAAMYEGELYGKIVFTID